MLSKKPDVPIKETKGGKNVPIKEDNHAASPRIQTAEGWKRSQMQKHKGSK